MRVGFGILAACGLAAAVAAPLLAAPQDVVKSRVASLRELGAAFKNVNDELKGGSPQIYIIQLSARQINSAARQQYGWFPAGTGPQPGVKTNAKREIWAQPAQFKAGQDAFAVQAAAFAKVAATGDMNAIRAQAKQLGATCTTCHRAYRVDPDR